MNPSPHTRSAKFSSGLALPSEADVLIIGGGALGLACAYYALRAGRTVCLVDRGAIGAGASWGNAGLVPLSAAVPLSGPGVIGKSLRWMVQSDGAFRMRPRLELAFVRWLLEFRRQCEVGSMRTTTGALIALVRESARLFEAIEADEGADFAYTRTGTLAVCTSEAELDDLRAKDRLLQELGVECRGVDAAQSIAMEPRLTAAVVGGTHYPEDSHLDPGKLARALAAAVRRRGATLLTGVTVRELTRDRDRVTGARTDAGTVGAAEVIVAAGTGSTALLRRAGIDVLIEPGKGYHLEFDDVPHVTRPIRLADAKVVACRIGGSLRLTAKLELTHAEGLPRGRVLERVPRLASRYMRLPSTGSANRSWWGFRPLTPDGLPYVGRPTTVGGVVLATGHGQLGIALAPITGAVVADLLSGRPSRVPLDAFRVERFSKRLGGK